LFFASVGVILGRNGAFDNPCDVPRFAQKNGNILSAKMGGFPKIYLSFGKQKNIFGAILRTFSGNLEISTNFWIFRALVFLGFFF